MIIVKHNSNNSSSDHDDVIINLNDGTNTFDNDDTVLVVYQYYIKGNDYNDHRNTTAGII